MGGALTKTGKAGAQGKLRGKEYLGNKRRMDKKLGKIERPAEHITLVSPRRKRGRTIADPATQSIGAGALRVLKVVGGRLHTIVLVVRLKSQFFLGTTAFSAAAVIEGRRQNLRRKPRSKGSPQF